MHHKVDTLSNLSINSISSDLLYLGGHSARSNSAYSSHIISSLLSLVSIISLYIAGRQMILAKAKNKNM